MTLGRTIGLILSSLPSQFIWAYHFSSQKFPRKPSRFNAREVFFFFILVSSSKGRQHQAAPDFLFASSDRPTHETCEPPRREHQPLRVLRY